MIPNPAIFYNGPMLVLVDRFSASASEIFAGAIQDYGRGLIVGQQTYGKGTVQNAHPLNYTIFGRKPELGQLNVTIGKYYRITGESTQDRGVTPDIAMPSLIDANEVGESTRDRALPWDHIEPAAFAAEGDLKPLAATLEKLHEERTAGSADFKYLREDIAALDAMRSQKTLSLNLKTREAERKRIDDARLERENAWRAAHDVKPAKSLEEIKDDATAGILLDEASQIAADMVVVSAKRAAPTQARRNDMDDGLTRRRAASAAVACTDPSSPRPARSRCWRRRLWACRNPIRSRAARASRPSAPCRRCCGIRNWRAAAPI